MNTQLCPACRQPLPATRRLCADCGHPMGYHAISERPPRLHKACTVHEAGTKCDCRRFTAAVT